MLHGVIISITSNFAIIIFNSASSSPVEYIEYCRSFQKIYHDNINYLFSPNDIRYSLRLSSIEEKTIPLLQSKINS